MLQKADIIIQQTISDKQRDDVEMSFENKSKFDDQSMRMDSEN